MEFLAHQLSFTLRDLIQLGDIVPYYNSSDKSITADRHEVHDYEDKLLISHVNKFQDKYNDLVEKLGGDGLICQQVKGKIYK